MTDWRQADSLRVWWQPIVMREGDVARALIGVAEGQIDRRYRIESSRCGRRPTIRCRGRHSSFDRQRFASLSCLRERDSWLRGAPDLFR